VGLADIGPRFAQLKAIKGSIAEKILAIISDAGAEINKLADESPALLSIIQHLEQAAHITVSSPHLKDPATADPTPAGSAPTDPASPATTSTGSSSSSAEGSTP
jgi:hypothetical protein